MTQKTSKAEHGGLMFGIHVIAFVCILFLCFLGMLATRNILVYLSEKRQMIHFEALVSIDDTQKLPDAGTVREAHLEGRPYS